MRRGVDYDEDEDYDIKQPAKALNSEGRVFNFFTPCWLHKQNHPLPTWKKRYFDFDVPNNRLVYFTSENVDDVPQGSIYIERNTSVGPAKNAPKEFKDCGFFINTDDDTYYLSAETTAERDTKMREISMMIMHLYNPKQAAAQRAPAPVEPVPDKYQVKNASVQVKNCIAAQNPLLDISCANLTQVPHEAYSAKHIQELNASLNKINIFPSLAEFPHLESIDLSSNKLVAVDQLIKLNVNLTSLNMGCNMLMALPFEIRSLQNLVKVDLRSNNFCSFPSEILSLTNLEELYLGNNKIESIPDQFLTLNKLEILEMNQCHLSQLPSEIGNLSRLLELNLANNNLRELPVSISALTRLCTLNISNNSLKDIPLEIGRCSSLNNFTAINNPVEDKEMQEEIRSALPDSLISYFKMNLSLKESRVVEEVEVAKPMPIVNHILARSYLSEIVLKLDEFRKQLMLSSTLQEAVQVALPLRALKAIVETIRPTLQNVERAPAPQIHPSDEKIVQLQKMTNAAMRDARNVYTAYLGYVNSIKPATPEWEDMVVKLKDSLAALGIPEKMLAPGQN